MKKVFVVVENRSDRYDSYPERLVSSYDDLAEAKSAVELKNMERGSRDFMIRDGVVVDGKLYTGDVVSE